MYLLHRQTYAKTVRDGLTTQIKHGDHAPLLVKLNPELSLAIMSKETLLIKLAVALGLLAFHPAAITAKNPSGVTSLQCLTANIYFEARGEAQKGRRAVADVTVNRKLSKRYPGSVCAVVFQWKQFSWTHQQPWAKIDKILQGKVGSLKKADKVAYNQGLEAAKVSLAGFSVLPKNVLHYHTKAVKPKWSKKLKKYSTIGEHIYYSSPKTKG